MRNLGIITLIALPLLVACNDKGAEEVVKPLTPFLQGQELSITSQPLNDYERSGVRKVHVREEVSSEEVCVGDQSFVTRLLWDTGDRIDVFVDDDATTHPGHAYPQAVFTLVSGANTSEGMFSGIMPADGTQYAVMYPHRDAGDAATKTIVEDYTEGTTVPYKVSQFYMPSVQNYRGTEVFESKAWPTFASELLPIFGKGNIDDGFETYPCGGALRFKLWSSAGETVRTIRLAARNNEDLAGSFVITPTTSGSVVMNMTPKTSGSGRHAVILRLPSDFTMPTTQEDAVWMYFVLPAPLTFAQGFGIYTYNEDIEDPESIIATPTHIFITPESANGTILIKQNHITTVTFGAADEKGNYGNINGDGWNE